MNRDIFKKVGIGIGVILMPTIVLAVDAYNPQAVTRPEILLQNITNWVAGIVLAIAVIMLLFSAFLYLTAGGNEDSVTRAKDYMIYSIVGIAVALLAFSVVPLLRNVFFGIG